MSAPRLGKGFDIDVHRGGDGGAVDERDAVSVGEQAVGAVGEHRAHGVVVGDNRDDRVGCFCDAPWSGRCLASQLGCEFRATRFVHIVHGGHGVAVVVQVSGHVRAHASNAHESDLIVRHVQTPADLCLPRMAI